MIRALVAGLLLLPSVGVCATSLTARAEARLIGPLDDEFVGPFRDWVNVKEAFGAVGDGKADDTEALQRALDSMRKGRSAVTPLGETLYLPAGTYRITRGLTMESHLAVAIYGEHPERTIIRWDGPGHDYKPGDRPSGVSSTADKAATMLYLNGVRHARFGRITWDGAGKALAAVEHEWDRKVTGAATLLEHEDEVFRDVGFGLRAGNMSNGSMDAETVVKRCHFVRNCFMGVSIESFNALNWWVWSSLFEDCRVGAGNEFGAGAVHVYHSLFLRSREADIRIRHVTSYFSARHNVSLGSRRFYESLRHPSWPAEHNWSGLFTLQDNLIIDPREPAAVWFETPGPLLLLDNEFVGAGGPVVRLDPGDGYEADCIAVGNSFTTAEPLMVKGRMFSEQNQVNVRGDETRPTAERLKATLPAVAKRFTGPVIEVSPGNDLQAAVDKAATLKGKRPLVYLGRGAYDLKRTLKIPARTDLQLVGVWGEGVTVVQLSPDSPDNVIIALAGPSHATLRRFSIHGLDVNNNKRQRKTYGTGLLVTGIDQPGARVWSPRMNVRSCSDAGVWADGLRFARMHWFNLEAQYHEGDALRITGPLSPDAPFQRERSPLHVIYNGNTSANQSTYALSRGARLVARDLWYEGPQPRFFTLKDRADFTLNGATISTADWHAGPRPAGEVRPPGIEVMPEFEGRFALLASLTWGGGFMKFNHQSEKSQVLLLGNLTLTPDGWARGDAFTAMHNQGFKPATNGTYGLPQSRVIDTPAILELLRDLRATKPTPRTPVADNVTELCLHDMFFRWCEVGLRLKNDNQ